MIAILKELLAIGEEVTQHLKPSRQPNWLITLCKFIAIGYRSIAQKRLMNSMTRHLEMMVVIVTPNYITGDRQFQLVLSQINDR